MKEELYKTVARFGSAHTEDRASRFIAYIDRASTREGFKALLDRAKSDFPDATHHCWAFRIGLDPTEELSSDNGEPSGSAGLPILRVLAGSELTNVACIVTRYFGGTKLGIGGLMRAYSQAAAAAIRDAGIVEKAPTMRFDVTLPYNIYHEFESALRRAGGKIIKSGFGAEVSVEYELPKSEEEAISSLLADLSRGKISPRIIKRGEHDKDEKASNISAD
ncbi:YigZ family protein [bacterium]|nr:YigZ family protein [bacterium]